MGYAGPWIWIYRNEIIFNAAASRYLTKPYMYLRKSGDRIYLTPTNHSDGYLVSHKANRASGKAICALDFVKHSGLRELHHYKLYKAGDSFVVKTFEPLEQERSGADEQECDSGRSRDALKAGIAHHG